MNRQLIKILLIEDNPAWVELIEIFLHQSSNHYQIDKLITVDDAVRKILTVEYDVALLDLTLPDSNGLEGVQRIRAAKINLPIIVLTVLDDENMAIDSLRQGAQDYLIKGQLKANLLSRAIVYAIERQRATERERLVRIILENFRRFPDLRVSLQVSVVQIKQFLTAQQVSVYRNHLKAELVAQASDWERISLIDHQGLFQLYSKLIKTTKSTVLVVEKIEQIDGIAKLNILESNEFILSANEIELLERLSVQSFLIITIEKHLDNNLSQIVSASETTEKYASQPWGLLIAYNYKVEKQQQQGERAFLRYLSDQLTINVAQSEIYSHLQIANQKLEELAMLDGLTELANRRHFDRVLYSEWQRLAREKKPLSLILCDIDFFKLYNDTYGHLAGDVCIKQVAKVLQQAVKRPADLVARYGGEEFAIILPDTSKSGALWVASKISQQIQDLQIPHSNSSIGNYVTLSLGITTKIPSTEQNPIQLIAIADRALYQAKQQGRNQTIAV